MSGDNERGNGSPGADRAEDTSGDRSDRSGGRDPPGESPSPGSEAGGANRPGPGEVFCYSCGEIIKERAEICPECGVRQRAPPSDPTPPSQGDPGLSTTRQRTLEKAANNDRLSTVVLSLFVPPLAYVEVGKPGYALLNVFTANYLLLGFLLVPFHTYATIDEARQELRTEGVRGY
jgi:hypothetical protein